MGQLESTLNKTCHVCESREPDFVKLYESSETAIKLFLACNSRLLLPATGQDRVNIVLSDRPLVHGGGNSPNVVVALLRRRITVLCINFCSKRRGLQIDSDEQFWIYSGVADVLKYRHGQRAECCTLLIKSKFLQIRRTMSLFGGLGFLFKQMTDIIRSD